MSSKLPTLLQRGVLIPRMGEQDLNNYVAIDYIMSWFDKKIKSNGPLFTNDISDRIIILKSGTGSGKSTNIAPYLYNKFNKTMKKKIIISQPRKLTTVEIATDVSNINSKITNDTKLELGKNLGYQTKDYAKQSKERGITFVTTGILLQKLVNLSFNEFSSKYGFVIIDEVHDRSIDIDTILFLIKSMLTNNPIHKCPFFILMSATLDIDLLKNYYHTNTIFEVIGKSYPISINFIEPTESGVMTQAVKLITDIHNNNPNDIIGESDILVFCSSMTWILKIVEKLKREKESEELEIIPLDSLIFKELRNEYLTIKKKINKRKVILSTNVSETGITIDSLKYCIDTGFYTYVGYNPNVDSIVILNKPIDQNMAMQRKGRVGRVRSGEWYALYNKESYEALDKNTTPDILCNDISIFILSILCKNFLVDYENDNLSFVSKTNQDEYYEYKLFNKNNKSNYITESNKFNILNKVDDLVPVDIYNLPFLDTPSHASIRTATNKLFTLGFIHKSLAPTRIGLLFNVFDNIGLEEFKILLSAYRYDVCIEDIITIVSFMQVPKKLLLSKRFKQFKYNLVNSENKNKEYDIYNINILNKRLLISCNYIDFLLFFNAFINIRDIEKSKKFCLDSDVEYTGMLKIIELKDNIINKLIYDVNLDPFKNKHKSISSIINIYFSNKKIESEMFEAIKNIKLCLYEGLKNKIAVCVDNQYYTLNNKLPLIINNYLTNNLPIFNNGKKFEQTKPKYILYDNIINVYNRNESIFTVSNFVTVLDGFVDIDNTFLIS